MSFLEDELALGLPGGFQQTSRPKCGTGLTEPWLHTPPLPPPRVCRHLLAADSGFPGVAVLTPLH